MHTVDEEGDPVSTAWCKFHGFLPEWEGDTSNFLIWIGMPLDICHFWDLSGYSSRNLRMPLTAVFEISCIERSSSGASARLSWMEMKRMDRGELPNALKMRT
jgi:hypothetical protein